MHRKTPWAKRVKKERFRKKYLTRMQATRLLQVDSQQFRRLCILKGIYPRAIGRSKQKASGNDKQYYLAKEIKWLVQDEVGRQCFAYKAWEKKIRRAEAMKLREDLKTLKERKPQYNLVATIKERYPFFTDALKDVDDAMTMIALYAFLSPEIQSDSTIEFHHALPSGLHEKSRNVVSQWLNYVSRAKCLTKGFISVKGYYFEVLVKGQRVTWLMPHEFAHKFPSGIQQYMLVTFLEFYVELMRFILFKLEADLKKIEEEQNRIEDEGGDPNTANFDGNDDVPAPIKNKASAEKSDLETISSLFTDFVFYISRECPKKNLSFVINSCGGRVVENFGPTVTHYIIDRPSLLPPHKKEHNVEYLQPQYVFDCLNAHLVLPVQGYRMGEELPPHVSPFTVAIANTPAELAALEETKKKHPKIVSYVPERVHELRKLADPLYNKFDPKNQLIEEDGDSEMSEMDREARVRELDDDEVSLDQDEAREARRKAEWQDETVTELPERSKLSALQVRKQRELNLMNRPTNEKDAVARAAAARAAAASRKSESAESRTRRKLAAKKKMENAERKMKLQVARKKAARYYKMVNATVAGVARREDVLAKKAAAIKKGAMAPTPDGKGITSTRKTKRGGDAATDGERPSKKPRTSPYSKVPKWVR